MAAAGTADYEDLVAAGRAAVLRSFAAAGMPDVDRHIVHELVITPPQWKERCGGVYERLCMCSR